MVFDIPYTLIIHPIIFSFKFAKGAWLVCWKDALAMIGFGIACLLLAVIGIFMIYISVDANNEVNNNDNSE